MDPSAIQPSATAGPSGIFAMFLPANAASDNTPASLFGSLLQDAVELAGSASLATADGASESSGEIDGNSASPVVEQPKGEGHKKQESKNVSGGSAGTLTPFMLAVAPMPIEPPRKPDQATLAPAASIAATQSQQGSNAQAPGTSVPSAPSPGTSLADITGKGTKLSGQPQADASTVTNERSTGRFPALPNSEILGGGPASKREGADIGPIAPELAQSKSAQKIAGHSEKSDEWEFNSHSQSSAAFGNTQIKAGNSAPAAKQFPPITSELSQPLEGQKPIANTMGHATSINTTATPNQQSPQDDVPLPAKLFFQPQGGLNLMFATNLSINDGASAAMNAAANAASEDGTALQREPVSPAPLNPSSTAFSTELPAAAPFQAEKNPQRLQAAIASPNVQPQVQTEPQFKAQPEIQHQHWADQAQSVSGSAPGKNAGDLLKSAVTNFSKQVSATHHSAINTQSAENRAVTKTDAAATPADSVSTNSTTTRGTDHKLNQADQANSATQSGQAATATPSLGQAVMPAATNAPAPPTGVSAAASQPVPAFPAQTATAKVVAHDLPAAVSEPSVPVQVHAARMFQSDGRSEMRLDMQTQSFGGVEVHTSVSGKDVQLSVSAEHGDLRGFLAPEMPVLQSNLQHHDLRLQQVRTLLSTGTQREFSSGSEQQEQRFARPHTRPGDFDQRNVTGNSEEEDSPKGLSIRI